MDSLNGEIGRLLNIMNKIVHYQVDEEEDIPQPDSACSSAATCVKRVRRATSDHNITSVPPALQGHGQHDGVLTPESIKQGDPFDLMRPLLVSIDLETARILHFLPEFQELVLKFDPTFKGNCKPLSKWKKAIVAQLLSEDVFQDLDTEKHTLKEWGNAIKRVYSNHFGYQMKVKGTGLDGTPPTAVAPANVQPAKSSNKIRSFLFFSGDISPHELFVAENHNELEATYKRICQDTGLPGGAARQTVLKELWAKANHKECEERAKTYLNDTQSNQEEFSCLALSSLEAMLSRGVLGSSMISMMYAYRRTNDCVCTEILSTGFNSTTGTFIEYQIDSEELTESWTKTADRYLPCSKSSSPLAYNEDGMPLFPAIDTRSLNLNEMIRILEDYFIQVWAHIHGGTAIPWDDIGNDPEKFYDMRCYDLPCPLKPPPALKDDEVLRLTKFLIRQSSGDTPFLFHPKVVSHEVKIQATNKVSPIESPSGTSPAVPATREVTQPVTAGIISPTSAAKAASLPAPTITTPTLSVDAVPPAATGAPLSGKKDTELSVRADDVVKSPAAVNPLPHDSPSMLAPPPPVQHQQTSATVSEKGKKSKKTKSNANVKSRTAVSANTKATTSTSTHNITEADNSNSRSATDPNSGNLRCGSHKRKTIDHTSPQPIVDPTSAPPPGKKPKPSWDWVPVVPQD
ncbi:unnamed protein product [Cyclocybe aegerita]|uniref:Uncharacterized protein n=1 Tax=Cyclocybe aegerita TaxID=1973307 RepID=A0A8S0WRS6_CYCAE|nr:unnamed protein product [Cyclocybe aegerita]